MKHVIAFLLFLFLTVQTYAEKVTTEFVIMLDCSNSVTREELVDFRNGIYNALDNKFFLEEIEDNGPILFVFYEFARDPMMQDGEYRYGEFLFSGVIKTPEDIITTKEVLFREDASIRGNTYTFRSLNIVLDYINNNEVESKQQTILVIGDGVADDYKSKDRYDFEDNFDFSFIKSNALSVMGLFVTDKHTGNLVDRHFVEDIINGEKAKTDIFSQETLENYLIDAIRVNVF